MWLPRGGGGGEMDGEFGIRRCKLLNIEWINNKVLLYSTGNYIQSPVINHNGKEYEKEYTCITESLCCTAEITIVNQLHFNKINLKKKPKCISEHILSIKAKVIHILNNLPLSSYYKL